MARGPKIGEVLVQAGLIDEFQLEAGLAQQQRWGGRLGRALVQLGFLQEADFVRVLSKVLNVPVVRLAEKKPSPDTLGLVPAELAEKYGCLPLFTKREGGANTLYLGIEDPSDLKALDELSFRIGMKVKPVLVGPSELREAIARTYHHRDSGEPEESSSIVGDSIVTISRFRKARRLSHPGSLICSARSISTLSASKSNAGSQSWSNSSVVRISSSRRREPVLMLDSSTHILTVERPRSAGSTRTRPPQQVN